MKNIVNKTAWLFMFVPLVYLAFAWKHMPAEIPMHYNLQGEVDRIGSKKEMIAFILILTAVNIGVYLLLINIHRIDRRKYSAANMNNMRSLAFFISLFIDAVLCWFIHIAVSGTNPSISFILTGVGLLFSIMGNYLYNIKPNYVAGFRLPWTLKDENNWRKTHHLAGRLWFYGGLLIAVCCILLPLTASMVVFGSILLVLILIPLVYSYRLHKQSI